MSTAAPSPLEAHKQQILAALAQVKFAPVYEGIEGAKPSGDGWLVGRCPFHDDHDPSFGFSTTTGQWSCFAGCGKGDAFEFLVRTTGRPFKDVLLLLGEHLGLSPPAPNGDGTGQIIYDYRDEEGALLYQVVRGPNKKFYQRRPDGSGGWTNNIKGVKRTLYRLPELLARPNETVFVVEGEKDADRLHAEGLLATTNSGGAGKWRDSHSVSLRGREVVILPDNDAPGRDHADRVARALDGIAGSIKIIELPNLPPKGDVSDWLQAGHTVQELRDLQDRTRAWKPRVEKSDSGPRPEITTNDRQQRHVVEDAWRAVLARNDPPQLFVCQGRLARLADDGTGPTIQHLGHAEMYGILLRAADWFRKSGENVCHAKPPREVADDCLANPHSDLPPLEAVLTTPVFDANWQLLSTPGYHREARVWLHLSGDAAAYDVPIRPPADELGAARALLLDDLLVDFPFTADSDRAHAVAAILLPFARRMFGGPTPIHLIEAPTPGSGKSLLADLISIIALGEPAGALTLTRDENETRKKITALLTRGRAVVSIDNIEGGLTSSQVAAAITCEVWDDRILGQTQMVAPPNKALWLVSANNPNLSLEIARRCVRIRLNPAEERPWTRTGFKHDPIQRWARRNRPALVHAVLTIIRSWIAAAAPQEERTLGSFESWSGLIGGLVAHVGLHGFLDDADDFYTAADAESGEWAAFVAAWWAQHRDHPVRASDLLALAEANDLVAFAYAGPSESARKARFGKALNGLRDRKFGELEVVIAKDSHNKTRLYRLRGPASELFSVGGESQ